MTTVLDLITFDPAGQLVSEHPDPIVFPTEFAPQLGQTKYADTAPLPKADVIVVTYTVAEGYALADVLSPGRKSTEWTPYRNNWANIKKNIHGEAPSLGAGCAGYWTEVVIGTRTVILFKSELHPSTDGHDLPMVQLWKQLVSQARPSLVITTGTAGGIGSDVQLGDVIVGEVVRWDCQKQFKNEAWATGKYMTSDQALISKLAAQVAPLAAINAHHLGSYLKRPIRVISGDIITTDFFAFDDSENTYGLRTFDPAASAVEMDDAACGLALSSIPDPPLWAAIRNASDPQIARAATLSAEDNLAGQIYKKYGYWTSIGSVLTCWAMIVAL